MKGICHKWSRGRHFSPSLHGDMHLKLSSQKRSLGRNLGEHRLVRRSGTASRGTALLIIYWRMRSFSRTEILFMFPGKKIRVRSTKYKTQFMAFKFARTSLLYYVHMSVVWSWELEIKLFTYHYETILLNVFFNSFLQYETYCSREKGDKYKPANAQCNTFICRIDAIINRFCRLVGRQSGVWKLRIIL